MLRNLLLFVLTLLLAAPQVALANHSGRESEKSRCPVQRTTSAEQAEAARTACARSGASELRLPGPPRPVRLGDLPVGPPTEFTSDESAEL